MVGGESLGTFRLRAYYDMKRYQDHELIFGHGFAGPTPMYSLYFKEGQPGAKSGREMSDAACPNSLLDPSQICRRLRKRLKVPYDFHGSSTQLVY